MLGFQNTDEINAYLFKDITPFEYCKSLVSDIVAEIRAMIQGNNPDAFDALDFFDNCQCTVYMKNHIVIDWDIEMTFEEIALPNPDEIEYVRFCILSEKGCLHAF